MITQFELEWTENKKQDTSYKLADIASKRKETDRTDMVRLWTVWREVKWEIKTLVHPLIRLLWLIGTCWAWYTEWLSLWWERDPCLRPSSWAGRRTTLTTGEWCGFLFLQSIYASSCVIPGYVGHESLQTGSAEISGKLTGSWQDAYETDGWSLNLNVCQYWWCF